MSAGNNNQRYSKNGSANRQEKEQPFDKNVQKMLPQINLPKGGGAIKGIEEKFNVNAATGTSSFGIPLPFSPSRNGFLPSLGLTYNSGAGNSPFGLGWSLAVPSISRKTEKELPRYRDAEDSDTFILSGAEDLVPLLVQQGGGNWVKDSVQQNQNGISYTVQRYRPRIESAFVRIEKWTSNSNGDVFWKTIGTANVHSYYGLTGESRICDPADPKKIFTWLLCKTHDDKGSIVMYRYKKEDFVNIPNKLCETNRVNKCTQTYLKTILYGNRTPFYLDDAEPAENQFLFKTVFDYGEHSTNENIPLNIGQEINTWPSRKDPFSVHRSGFDIRTYRRCSRVLMFHCFDAPDLPHNPYLVRSLQLEYAENLGLNSTGTSVPGFSFLVKARQNGHKWNPGTNSYTTKYLPELELHYQQHEWNTAVETVEPGSLVHAPSGINNKQYLWADLYSEGVAGILTEQNEGWYYKSNLGNGQFSQAEQVAAIPSYKGLTEGTASIQELEGNGIKYLVYQGDVPNGFFRLDNRREWKPFVPFAAKPNIPLTGENIRAIDLTGDHIADLLVNEENVFRWYRGLGEKGFELSGNIKKEIDEEKGPSRLFEDGGQAIFLADMDGDGLTDIIRIRNGEICYWPNQGYGRFGAKVSMDNAPWMDHPDTFNPAYIRLADIDGSGTADIIYLGKNDFRVWMNLNGNEFSALPQVIPSFPKINNLSDVAVLDLLGTGTASIVYSTPEGTVPLQYINLMGGKKPNLFTGYINNCGKEITIEYTASTQFYLADKKAGSKWVTTLPFPVHCISKIKTEDKIRGTLLVSTYSYRHGYYDAEEKEFRGFARAEQLDTEDFEHFRLNNTGNVVEEDLHQPPVRTITWFHTGAYLQHLDIVHQCKSEYFQNNAFAENELLPPEVPAQLSPGELKELYRALKGRAIRTEVYAADNSSKSPFPYTTSSANFEVRLLQPRISGNAYASFLVMPCESVAYNYDRNPADPRITQSCVLETDELGNILKSVAVIYPRVQRPLGPNAIPDKVWDEQNRLHISYKEFFYTSDIVSPRVYRLRAGYESKIYEIAGLLQPPGFYFRKHNFTPAIPAAQTIPYDEEFTAGIQKRLSGHTRNYFLKNDLSGPLPLAQMESLGIPHKSYQLVFTSGLIAKHYAGKVTAQMLQDAGYVHSEGDQHWWAPTGESIYPAQPQNSFYQPSGARDIFGNQGFVQYDAWKLLTVSVTDPLGNIAQAENDYRTLGPVMMTDANLNQSAIETDELGEVVRSAIMGKAGAGDGDTLNDPTATMEYNLLNWKNNGKPNFVRSRVREKHGPANNRWQEGYAYSDGNGSIIMTKNQTSAGKAKIWDEIAGAVIEVNADPRWIGNGRTILNNKGNPVKSYEPYFSATHEYEGEAALVETGATSINYYDAIGRNYLVRFPNGTFSRTDFDSWHYKTYDANDTVKDSEWYIERGSPDPLMIPEPVNPEQRAAWLAAKHYNTPGTTYSASSGTAFYVVTDHGNGKTTSAYSETDIAGRFALVFDQKGRKVSEGYGNLLGVTMYGKSAEKGERWVFNDAAGRLVRVWDDNQREFYGTYDPLHRPVSSFVKEGLNEYMVSHIVYGDLFADAAQRNMKGGIYQVYDQGGVLTIKTIDFKGNPLETERRFAREYKQVVNWNVLAGLNSINAIAAAAEPLLETETFNGSATADALNRPVHVTLPDQTVLEPVYNEAGELGSLRAKIRGQGNFITFLESQAYDAKGQRQYALYGNGLSTRYAYDPKTYRLTNIVSGANGALPAQSCQNLFYTYDPTGNIVACRDLAQQDHFFMNAVVPAENKFEYDALYRLVLATGREHAGLGGNAQRNQFDLPFITPMPHINNPDAVRNYTEKYTYDDFGNLLQIQHLAANSNWNQFYRYHYQDDPAGKTNRLSATSLPGDAVNGPYSATYQYDTQGNMTKMPHLDAMVWNFMSQLKEVDLGGGGKAYYVYGAGGNRTRKIIERPGGKKIERYYFGPVEIYRESEGAAKTLERNTLFISDNTGCIAQVDTKTFDPANSDPANLLNENLVRYQYGNNIGSATLETNENGVVISYEEYHPYGTSAYRLSRSNTDLSLKRYRFSGKEKDSETAFYYFGARYYAPWLGRWTSSDPAGFVDGLNLYAYCSNNPVMIKDPTGTNGNEDRHIGLSVNSQTNARGQTTISYSLHIEIANRETGERYVYTASGNGVEGLRQIFDTLGTNSGFAQHLTVEERGQLGSAINEFARSIPPPPPSSFLEGGELVLRGPVELLPPTPPPPRSSGGGTRSGSGSRSGSSSRRPVTTSSGATGGGARAVTANPTGPTLEVPNNFDDEKIAAYRDRITTDRGVGIRGEPPGGGSRTADIRQANQGLRDAFEAGLPGGQRPAGTQIDHTVELQNIIRGNATGGSDVVRPGDHRVQASGTNASQGASGQQANRRQIAAGFPEDVPAGGVARTSDIGRFYNRPGFRTALRGLGYTAMVAGPVLTAWGSSQIDNAPVRYGGYSAAAVEAGGAGYYLYGRFALGGAQGFQAGTAAMNLGGRVALGAGGVAQALISGYSAYQDYQNNDWVAFGFDAAAAVGGVCLIAAAVVTAPVWGTALAVVGVVTGIAAGVFHLGRAFSWW